MVKNALQAQLLKAGLVDNKKAKKLSKQAVHEQRTGQSDEAELKAKIAQDQQEKLEKDPDLKSRVDDYRIRNYRLQQSENVDLYDAVDSLERDSYALRKSEKANAYLEAELEVCKMVQKVQDRISEEIRIGVPEI